MGQHVETLVIGAGSAGLTAAYVLAKAGRDVAVLEMDLEVGGSSRAIDHHGFRIEQGGGARGTTSPEVLALWSELLPDGLDAGPQAAARIYLDERFYAYPLKTLQPLTRQGLRGGAACLASLGLAKIRPIKTPRTFGDEIRNRVGARLSRLLFVPFAEKVSGLVREQMPAGRSRPEAWAGGARYPRDGGGALWRACADRILALGGQVAPGHRVASLRFDAATKLWTAPILRQDGVQTVWTAEHVVSTAPLRELVNMLRPMPISLFHAGELMYRDQITVALVGGGRGPAHDVVIDVHDTSLQVSRVRGCRPCAPSPKADSAESCLALDYFCFEGDGLWSAADADLIELAWREAAVMGLLDPTAVSDAVILRQRKVLPIEDETCAEHRAMIRLDLKMQFPSLHLAGRNGLHVSGDDDQAVLSGLLTAENILSADVAHDVWTVTPARRAAA